jgi:aryl-alcohol dehydrogenase-like predicted oxidoreductase
MRTARLGSIDVPVVGVGCNNVGRTLDLEATRRVVDAALDRGLSFFDSSDNYGGGTSERLLARALGSRRSDVVILTKFGSEIPGVDGSGGARPEYVRSAVRRSLAELNTDWIDVYLLHKPDPDTPIAETLGAMWDLMDEGVVREIGCSNLDAVQLAEALETAHEAGRPAFVANQVEYSLANPAPWTNGLRDLAVAHDVALLPFYPLASGMLTGKVIRGQAPEGRLQMDRYRSFRSAANFNLVDRLRPFAAERGLTMVQVALGWLLAQPEVPVVSPGATKPEQIVSNATAADWQPSAEDLATLDALASA